MSLKGEYGQKKRRRITKLKKLSVVCFSLGKHMGSYIVQGKKKRLKCPCSLLFISEESCSYNCIEHGYYFKRCKVILFDGSWPKTNSKLAFCGKCQHFNIFSNTAVFKKSPNSCSRPAFLASSIRHNAKTQQKECLLIVYAHYVYKTCTLFLVDSSRGSTTSSAFHFQRFSTGVGYSKLAVGQSNHQSTMTRSSLLLCVSCP